jgi:hypothetical protein
LIHAIRDFLTPTLSDALDANDKPVFERSSAAASATALDLVASKLRLAEVTEPGGDAGLWCLGGLSDLGQRSPLAIDHDG